MTEYEYEYYSVSQNCPNTNTNNIRFQKVTRLQIRIQVFGLNYSNYIRIPNYLLTAVQNKVNYREHLLQSHFTGVLPPLSILQPLDLM